MVDCKESSQAAGPGQRDPTSIYCSALARSLASRRLRLGTFELSRIGFGRCMSRLMPKVGVSFILMGRGVLCAGRSECERASDI